MSRRPRDIGTAAETAVVRHLQASGFPLAERRALHGAADLGDVTGTPGLVWEVKGGEAAKTASDGQIAAWLDETACERANAGAEHGFLIVQRARKNVRDWWAVVDVATLAVLAAEVTPGPDLNRSPVRLVLDDLLTILRDAGWTDHKTNQL